MRRRGLAAFLLLAVFAGAAAGQTQMKAPGQTKATAKTATKAASASPDFSGTWKLDEAASTNVSPNMKGAILVVEQKGDHIRVTPGPQTAGKVLLAGDEIIVDGQAYEKSVGGGKGVLTARWSADRKELQLELSGEAPETGRKMIQTTRWTISSDRSTWVRETSARGDDGKARLSRLVFRRQKSQPAAKSAPAKPVGN